MDNLTIKEIRTPADLGELTKQQFIDFLYHHLDRFGDSKSAIEKAIDYAFSESEGKGGFLLAAYYDNKLVGALVMNDTGMSEYVPENILVYVAVDSQYRGKGFGEKIIKKSFELARGDIKLHVEYENPAKRLYERLGMKTKYAEMRLEKKKK
jgi:GNAT superfamily N-acetyltransferase